MKNAMDGFKRVSSDQHTMTLKHPHGHEIKVAIRALSPSMRDKIMALPQHLASGGEVLDPASAPENYTAPVVAPSIPIQVGSQPGPSAEPVAGGELLLPPVAPPQPVDPSKPQIDSEFQKAYDMFRTKTKNESSPAASEDTPENQNRWSEDANQWLYRKRKREAVESNQEKEMATASQGQLQSSAQKAVADYQKEVAVAQKLGIAPPPVSQAVKDAAMLLQSPGADASRGLSSAGGVDPTQPTSTLPVADQEQASKKIGDMTGADAEGKYLNMGVGMEISGKNAEAKALGDMAREQAKAQDPLIAAMQDAAAKRPIIQKQMQQQHDEFIKHAMEDKIDPNRYMASFTTGERISTTIGLILGGLGGGLLHQENAALKHLNQLIDRDVMAQKDESGRKMNIYKANLEFYKNEQDALTATTLDMKGLAAARAEQIALKSQDAVLKSRAMQFAGHTYAENAKEFGGLAARKAMQDSMSGMKTNDPETKIKMLKAMGQVSEPEADKLYTELGEAQKALSARDDLLGDLQKIRSINTIENRLAHPRETARQVAAIMDPALEKLTKETAGRVTPESVGLLKNIFSKPFDSEATFQTQLEQAAKISSRDLHFPRLKANSIDWESGSRYQGMGQKKIQLGAPRI